MNELLERRCVHIESSSEPSKNALRDELARLTAEFEASGRQIYHAPPNQYDKESRLGTTINHDREVERADRMARLPDYLKAPKNESGCRGVIRDGLEWIARWGNKRIGKYQGVDEAIKELCAYLEFIGYKPD